MCSRVDLMHRGHLHINIVYMWTNDRFKLYAKNSLCLSMLFYITIKLL